ncbi:hypothetical protein [Microlunatus soli]|nr:hypothetical protein [Microlunatus soli]
MIMVTAMAALAVVAAGGLIVDGRQILGESVWLKPFKFAVSFVLYGATLAWLLSRLDPLRRIAGRIGWWCGTAFAVTGIIDVAFVAIQAARGTFSHFNSDPERFNRIGQQVFQWGVIGLFLANLVLVIVLLIQRAGSRAINTAMIFGLPLAAAGMVVAFALAGGGHRYQVTDAYGHPVELGAAHTVGAAPGGPGLPLVGWSTTAGDLRVPHFFGMHVIHLLLALVLVLVIASSRYPWLRPERIRTVLITVAGIWCTGIFLLLAAQAAIGQSVIMIDPRITGAGCALTALSAVAVGLAVVHARRTAAAPRPPETSAAGTIESVRATVDS